MFLVIKRLQNCTAGMQSQRGKKEPLQICSQLTDAVCRLKRQLVWYPLSLGVLHTILTAYHNNSTFSFPIIQYAVALWIGGKKSNQPSLKYQKHQSNETNTPLKSLCFLKYSPKHKLSNFRKCLISAQHHHQASENSLSSNSSAWKHPSRLLMFFTAPSS